jgi:5'-nucleotidase
VIIKVDVDGVVADLITEWLRLYNEDWHDDLTQEKVTAWSMTEFVKAECGPKIYDYLNRPDLYDRVEPIKGALRGVRELDKMARVVYVSDCTPVSARTKAEWLKRHGFMEYGQYIGMVKQTGDYHSDKRLIRGDIVIDDAPHNLTGGWGYPLLFDAHHNQECISFTRCADWDDVVRKVDEYEHERAA